MRRKIFVGLWAGLIMAGCSGDDRPGLCIEVADDIPSFVVCEANDVSCTFWFQVVDREDEMTCDELCGDTTCLRAFDDIDRGECTIGDPAACDQSLADGVCECVGSP